MSPHRSARFRCWELVFIILATIRGVAVQVMFGSALYVLDIRVLSIAVVSAARLGWGFRKWLEELRGDSVSALILYKTRTITGREEK